MKKLMIRNYYSDYVNHMVKFFLTCPDGLTLGPNRHRCDIENWVAVQGVFHGMSEADRETIIGVYKTHYQLATAIAIYCREHEKEPDEIISLLNKTRFQIAKRRGLI